MSESGGLDMKFKRPIIVPPFFEGKGIAENKKRRLLDEKETEKSNNDEFAIS